VGTEGHHATRVIRPGSRLPAAILVCLCLLLVGLASPSAVAAAPGATQSRYIDTLSQAYHYDLGCRAAMTKVSGLSVLIYGKPVRVGGSYGASLYGGRDASTARIGEAVKDYARGYVRCSFRSRPYDTYVNLVVATTNCCTGSGPVHAGHGMAWAQMVNAVNRWARSQGYADKVRVRGGSDMEPGFNRPSPTWLWWEGYHRANGTYLYNVGSADGCPATGTGRINARCNNYWRLSDLYGLSWGGDAVPLPQIYRNDGIQAWQWQQIKLYGIVSRGRAMTFMGSLTQYRACRQATRTGCVTTDNTPAQGWEQLRLALASDPRTRQSLPYSTDISWR
jgi:hypothetical protein